MGQFVLTHDLDGIDIDWEETTLVVNQSGVGEAWLATFTQTLRQQLPKGQFILTHAPVGPWFQPGFCPGGCYLTVDKTVGSLIDWYNIQFYNRESLFDSTAVVPRHGADEVGLDAESPSPGYEDCNTLLFNAGGSAVFQIQSSGVDINKLVIGKPGIPSDVTRGGYIAPATLNTCIQQAVQRGWNAGVMSWQVCVHFLIRKEL